MGLWLISSSSSFKKKVGNIQRVSKEFLLNSSSAGFGDLCLLLSGRMILFFFFLVGETTISFPDFFSLLRGASIFFFVFCSFGAH